MIQNLFAHKKRSWSINNTIFVKLPKYLCLFMYIYNLVRTCMYLVIFPSLKSHLIFCPILTRQWLSTKLKITRSQHEQPTTETKHPKRCWCATTPSKWSWTWSRSWTCSSSSASSTTSTACTAWASSSQRTARTWTTCWTQPACICPTPSRRSCRCPPPPPACSTPASTRTSARRKRGSPSRPSSPRTASTTSSIWTRLSPATVASSSRRRVSLQTLQQLQHSLPLRRQVAFKRAQFLLLYIVVSFVGQRKFIRCSFTVLLIYRYLTI